MRQGTTRQITVSSWRTGIKMQGRCFKSLVWMHRRMILSSLLLAEAVSMSWIKRAHVAVSCVTRCTESPVAYVFYVVFVAGDR